MALLGADMVQAVNPAMTTTGSKTATCVARWLWLSSPAFPNHTFACPIMVTPLKPMAPSACCVAKQKTART